NIRLTQKDIEGHGASFETFSRVRRLAKSAGTLAADAGYLNQAEMLLPEGDPWIAEARGARLEILKQLVADGGHAEVGSLRSKLKELRRDYAKHYVSLHAKARLGLDEDRKKKALMTGKT